MTVELNKFKTEISTQEAILKGHEERIKKRGVEDDKLLDELDKLRDEISKKRDEVARLSDEMMDLKGETVPNV